MCAFPRAIKWRKTETATPSEGSTCRSERKSERSACVPERESVSRGHTKRRIQAERTDWADSRACVRLPPSDKVEEDRDSDALRGEHMPERTEE